MVIDVFVLCLLYLSNFQVYVYVTMGTFSVW